jgi:biopolymer transport protein ExbD
MDFRRGIAREEPEINLIPMIDVLLVILIFLMVSTTYTRFAELQINLPQADANKPVDRPNQINVGVDAQGKYVVNRTPTPFQDPAGFAEALKRAAGAAPDPVIIINADANASHQSVINIMEAARIAGYARITFTTQLASPGK